LKLSDLRLAYRREGKGPPLVLLHGWPEWSGVWRRNLPALVEEFDVIAPDLRNFGGSVGAEAASVDHYVADLEQLADTLELERFGLVSHDVGAYLAQDYARRHPERLAGLFFFDCPHFALGRRWIEGGQAREIWYQFFHQLPLSAELVGASRDTARAYFQHFLSHWSHDPRAFESELEEWVDTFLKPGRLEGGFRWYSVANERRLKAVMQGEATREPRIDVPAYALWGKSDPIVRAEWRDTLSTVFSEIEVELADEAGHFVHWEQPALANGRVAAFFTRRFAQYA
jgi:pimeloyl-ACP methyl ester carboxylesterase